MTCFDRERFENLLGEFCEFDMIDQLDVLPRGQVQDLGMGDKGACTSKLPKDPDDEHVWFFPAVTSYGDYANTTLVEKSNHRVLLAACEAADQDEDEVPDDCRPWFVTLSGGYGSNAIAVHIDRTPDSIVEMLEGLSRYPLLDESDYSDLETEAQEEAWNDTYRDEYRGELEKHFTEALEVFAERHGLEIDTDVSLADVTDGDISLHFWHWSQEANEYWESDGMSQYIDVEKVAKEAAESLFIDPEAKPKGWEWPEGIPANLAPVFIDPRQAQLPFKEGLPERLLTPRPVPVAPGGPPSLTAKEVGLVDWMLQQGWYKARADAIDNIMRQRAARGGAPLEGLGQLRTPRAGLFDLSSWNRKLGRR